MRVEEGGCKLRRGSCESAVKHVRGCSCPWAVSHWTRDRGLPRLELTSRPGPAGLPFLFFLPPNIVHQRFRDSQGSTHVTSLARSYFTFQRRKQAFRRRQNREAHSAGPRTDGGRLCHPRHMTTEEHGLRPRNLSAQLTRL